MLVASNNLPLSNLNLLGLSLKIFIACVMLAQVVFVSYLLFGYGFTAATEGWSNWNSFNKTAYVENDLLGNIAYAGHVLLAIAMLLGGSLQLIPALRNRFKSFHRINGRIVVSLACLISIAGIYLILVRGTVGNTLMHSLTIFAGVVILISSVMCVKAARNKSFKVHQIWAIRLYLAANGVLFFRLMIFAWFMVFGQLGVNTADFTGITVVSISVASYVLPLFVAEWVRYSKFHRNTVNYYACSLFLLSISAVFLVGLFSISVGNWYPTVFT